VLAARALPLTVRGALILGLWLCALPAVRRDLRLRAPGALRRIELSGECQWSVAWAGQGPALPATPSPQCVVLGAVLWLKFETAAGPRCACIVNRALAMRLRLAGRAATGRASGGTPSC